MKFCYCPSCHELKARNWYFRGKCEDCKAECITFDVKRSAYGILMYLLDAIALALVVLHMAWYQLSMDWASFYAAVSVDLSTLLIFGLIFASIGLAFVDIAKTTKKAQKRVKEGFDGQV